MIYFGCWGPAGHYFYRPDGHCSSKEVRHKMQAESIYPMIDGGFCPGTNQNPDGSRRQPERGPYQEQGVARLTHHNGWTILAFWDRTGDSRFGSNSNFIESGLWDFETMVAKAKETFPRLWERFTFEVKLYEPQPRRRILMPIHPDWEPLHTGTDLELSQKLTRECSSLYEITLRALVALGWRRDNEQDLWRKPGNGTDLPTITGPALDELCRRNDDPERLARIMISMGWEREGRIIWRAAEDLPTYIRLANHIAGRSQ